MKRNPQHLQSLTVVKYLFILEKVIWQSSTNPRSTDCLTWNKHKAMVQEHHSFRLMADTDFFYIFFSARLTHVLLKSYMVSVLVACNRQQSNNHKWLAVNRDFNADHLGHPLESPLPLCLCPCFVSPLSLLPASPPSSPIWPQHPLYPPLPFSISPLSPIDFFDCGRWLHSVVCHEIIGPSLALWWVPPTPSHRHPCLFIH